MAEEFNLSIYNDVYDMSFNQETEEIHIELKEGYYPLSNNVDLSNYYTKPQSDSRYKSINYVPSWGSIGGDIENQTDLQEKFDNYYNKTETYNKNEVNSLISNIDVDLSNYYNKSESDSRYKSINYVPTWSEISGKPTTFTPSAHTHTISEVINLQSTLANKEDKLNAVNLGEILDTQLSIKMTPSADDEIVILDSITGDAATVKFSSFGGNVDTSNLVPYTGATQDVNIASNYFKTSKGFDFTFDADNYFRSFYNGTCNILEFNSKDNSADDSGSMYVKVDTEEGFIFYRFDRNGITSNRFGMNSIGTYSKKPFVSDEGFIKLDGTANQALTANGGVFDLNTKADLVGGKVPATQLPSYVDDVLEFANLASFPATGESGKIYIAIDTNLTYRWGGSSYVVMSSSLALGETSSTAYRGDRGKIAYDHSQTTGNPHGTTKTDIGLGNVPNIDATNPTNIVQTSSYRFVTDSEKTNLSTAYTHSQATGNPHNTKLEELTDVGSETPSIEDTDIILKKESGGLWKKITFANFKNWFTTELAKKINTGVDTVFNFKNISAMTLTEFRSITQDIETIYFTEEQNGTGWQQVRYNGLGITIPATTETVIALTNENFIELDSDSTFNLIDVANTKINGIFEKDFVIIKFNAGVVTPATANQWFKVILKINGVQTAVSPVFYLTETSGTVEQIAHNFALNVPAEMLTNGATLHLKTSTNLTFNNPAITVVRVHKSTNANL